MKELGDWPVFGPDECWDASQAALAAAGLSDGLPLVVPTTQRLEAMLSGCSDPGRSHGLIAPLFGDLTNAAIAYNCVLAGCAPGALPVVTTALVACLDESFNLLGIATTTGSPAIATIVHGPVIARLGMNSDVNCLGPGNAVNAALGRAIALALRNIAGVRTDGGDMATMGQPAKYGMCFPEGQARAFAPFHVRHGVPADESAITVLGISGTAEVLPSHDTGNWDRPEDILRPVALVMRTALVAGGGARKTERGEQVLLLPPELAELIAQRGWRLDDVQRYLFASEDAVGSGAIAGTPEDIHVIVTGGPGVKMTVLPLWGGGTQTVTRSLMTP
mgnify:FL=1